MQIQVDLSQAPRKLQKSKRMLEIVRMDDGRDKVFINWSSIATIQDCMRKSQYLLMEKLKSDVEHDALVAGKAIHKGMEFWYHLPIEHRQLTADDNELADTFTGLLPEVCPEGALGAIYQYALAAQPLKYLDPGDKRSIANGIKIMKAYFKHYKDDEFETYWDEQGSFIERELEMQIYEDSTKVIVLHGTIDAVLRNKQSGKLYVADHKTTTALGTQFYNKAKPNHQYSGYIYLAQKKLGLDIDECMINGIQVAKTKSEFARLFTKRDQDDFDDLIKAAVEATERILFARETGEFTMSTASCNVFGTCQYFDICSVPKKMREQIIKTKYTEGV